MTSVNTIAQVVGLIMSIVSVGVLINTTTYRQIIEEFTKNHALCYLGGMLALFFGLFILMFHNAWETNWTTIITIIGWLSVIKGALLIVYPNIYAQLTNWMRRSGKFISYIGVLYLLLGLFLTVKGFNLI